MGVSARWNRRFLATVGSCPYLHAQWPVSSSPGMNWQVLDIPPAVPPHLRPSQSLSLLAEPDAERPMQVVAAGIVSVVVVNLGKLIFIVADVVVTEEGVTSGESTFFLHVLLTQ